MPQYTPAIDRATFLQCKTGTSIRALSLMLALIFCPSSSAQNVISGNATEVPLQPFILQVRQVERALEYLGEPLNEMERQKINAAVAKTDEAESIAEVESVLEPHVLMVVNINPESRVQVRQGAARPELIAHGTRSFLVKVLNGAGVTARLVVESPNNGDVFIQSNTSPDPAMKLTAADVRDRWMNVSLYDKNPMSERLSGVKVEYRIVQIFSRDAGQRSAQIGFNVGQGTEDIGFRNDVVIPFQCLAVHTVKLRIMDEKGVPATAAITVRDTLNRLYPNPSKRLAPDMFFEPQVYRVDGESVQLPPGEYTVSSWMGPEYLPQTKHVAVTSTDNNTVAFNMQRWIDPPAHNWYSGDHHVHAAGCSHYQNPSQGVDPRDMFRQVSGERLNVGAVLTWGPCYYYQKQFFSGKDDPTSNRSTLIHYDLEVSGFPSSHAGHLVLLGLEQQDYPETHKIEEWPTWDLPILRWAKQQRAVTGFAHSGFGLEVPTDKLPNYEMPAFDGIGANEYIVDVTYPDTVDFISTADTPYVWELNIWYQTLNLGFRTRISGETDFPCISDSRVGLGRVYAKVDGHLTYNGWLNALRTGRSYVSDGRSHLMNFTVSGVESGTRDSEVKLAGSSHLVDVSVDAAAYLDPLPATAAYLNQEDQPPDWITRSRLKRANNLEFTPSGPVSQRPYTEKPYWDVERARIAGTREVSVQLVVNGVAVAEKRIVADGKIEKVGFRVPIKESSWLAVRILGSSHSNPIFALVDDKPIRASRASAQWCISGVNQCWTQKAAKIAPSERAQARAAYDHALQLYETRLKECTH